MGAERWKKEEPNAGDSPWLTLRCPAILMLGWQNKIFPEVAILLSDKNDQSHRVVCGSNWFKR